jgi:membrane protease YdiL (CAAX protease family)
MGRKPLLVCGILSSLLYVAMNVFVPMLDPAYRSASQSVSELSAIGAPTRSVWVPLGIVYTLLVTAFGWGVRVSAGPHRSLRIAGGLLMAYGIIGAFWPPMHLRGTESTLTDTLHIVWTIVTVLLMMLAIGFGAMAFGARFRLYSIASLVVLVAFGVVTGLDAPGIAANLPTPWIGVWERINIGVFLLWVVVLAVALLRVRNAAASQELGFLERHAVLAYFALTFAISWGGMLLVLGPGAFTGGADPNDARLPFLFLAMYAGPTTAGLLMTGLVRGTTGFRELLSRLLTWRVAVRWYAVALLTAPVLITAVLLALSRTSPGFLPSIVAADDKASLLLMGILAGLMTGVFEELGWTGFVIPQLRQRHGVLTTGLIVGVLWGAWHYPLFSAGDLSGALPLALFLPVQLLTFLPAFRVLLVWIHDRTASLLLTMLMHAGLTASTLTLQPAAVVGMTALTYNVILAAVLWIVVAAIAMATRGQLALDRRPRLAA